MLSFPQTRSSSFSLSVPVSQGPAETPAYLLYRLPDHRERKTNLQGHQLLNQRTLHAQPILGCQQNQALPTNPTGKCVTPAFFKLSIPPIRPIPPTDL